MAFLFQTFLMFNGPLLHSLTGVFLLVNMIQWILKIKVQSHNNIVSWYQKLK
jgi:succinate dehydrogenase/fumarate reductase cytochrome b subunit